MSRHPVKLVGTRLSRASKVGTNLGELSGDDEAENVGSISPNTAGHWSQRKIKRLYKNCRLLNIS